MTWNTSDYLRTVTAIAEEALAEYPGDTSGPADQVNEIWASVIDDGRSDYVSQSVDGSEYVIYYGANETVLEASDNEPDGAEVRAISGDDADWRDQRSHAAYLAMEADVLAEVERLIAAQRAA